MHTFNVKLRSKTLPENGTLADPGLHHFQLTIQITLSVLLNLPTNPFKLLNKRSYFLKHGLLLGVILRV